MVNVEVVNVLLFSRQRSLMVSIAGTESSHSEHL